MSYSGRLPGFNESVNPPKKLPYSRHNDTPQWGILLQIRKTKYENCYKICVDMYIYMSICFLLIDPMGDASAHVCFEEVPVTTDDPSYWYVHIHEYLLSPYWSSVWCICTCVFRGSSCVPTDDPSYWYVHIHEYLLSPYWSSVWCIYACVFGGSSCTHRWSLPYPHWYSGCFICTCVCMYCIIWVLHLHIVYEHVCMSRPTWCHSMLRNPSWSECCWTLGCHCGLFVVGSLLEYGVWLHSWLRS